MHATRTIPGLPVVDIEEVTRFYEDKLGFDIGYPDDTFAIAIRDGVELHPWARV